MIQEFVEESILNRIASRGLFQESVQLRQSILSDTTPVPYFGDLGNSKIFTLGINPSSREFPKSESERRLVHLSDIDLPSDYYRNGERDMSREAAMKVATGLNEYFERRPYEWFDSAEKCIDVGFGASYFKEKSEIRASHLDVFPWATEAYSKLSVQIQKEFREENCSFLLHLLKEIKPQYLIILGRGTMDAFQKQIPFVYHQVKTVSGIHNSTFQIGITLFGDQANICFLTSKGPSAHFYGKDEERRRMETHEAFGEFIQENLSTAHAAAQDLGY